ncbi:MAG: hypothetical protein E8D45_07190 [Nitrospira sp.]|nr:MAG: hypothetical protein E8D45_07190 [Nitrospira sp.]
MPPRRTFSETAMAASLLLAQWAAESTRSAWLRGIALHISGCPNSCAKQQVADIGLVGSMTVVNEERRYTYLMTVGGSLGETNGKIFVSSLVESHTIRTRSKDTERIQHP